MALNLELLMLIFRLTYWLRFAFIRYNHPCSFKNFIKCVVCPRTDAQPNIYYNHLVLPGREGTLKSLLH